jgi:hypothetical protein
MESKITRLGLTPAGVQVERDTAMSTTNGATWRVTFLDDSPANPNDFSITLGTNTLTTQGGTTGDAATTITVTIKSDGLVYDACTGDKVVPGDKPLQMGQQYFARVSAMNEIGFSPASMSLTSQKPMVVPGPPTSVVLTSAAKDELKVTFNPPVSDGGDAITSYRIEYSTSLLFTSVKIVELTYLEGGSPFSKTIKGLTTGTQYYVRVAAINSQGVGAFSTSTPDQMNPHESPAGPANVKLRVTSNSMLTVSFDLPDYNGGDAVTMFKVEWDTSATFTNTKVPMPHKGSVEIDASTQRSHTITLLSEGQAYYVRVYAKNNAGWGAPAVSSPAYAIPALAVPGKPHTISAAKGDSTGEIAVSWQMPRVPYHGIPCSGLTTSPEDCPAEVGGTLPSSFGGTAIKEYLVEYNEKADFTGNDGGSITTTQANYILGSGSDPDLTSRRTYYIRVLARNAQGSGLFCANSDTDCLIVSSSTVVSAVAK